MLPNAAHTLLGRCATLGSPFGPTHKFSNISKLRSRSLPGVSHPRYSVDMQPVILPAPRARFPDRIAAPAPRGMRTAVKLAAADAGMTAAAFVRAAVADRLRTLQEAANG